MPYFIILFLFSTSLLAKDLKINGIAISHEKLYEMAKETKNIVDPVYKGKVVFKVIPFEKILTEDPLLKSVKFKALDGFTSLIPGSFFKNSKAYLAIENPQKKWPVINKNKSAGPYYLVWANINSQEIGQEQWPFQISQITIEDNVENLYPALLPKNLSEQAKKGFKVFTKNCFSCHKLNKYGEATMGPDLNHPMNPTEYFKLGVLKKFIRNPRSIRKWRGMKMPGFDENTISNEQMDNLIQYLKEISKTN